RQKRDLAGGHGDALQDGAEREGHGGGSVSLCGASWAAAVGGRGDGRCGRPCDIRYGLIVLRSNYISISNITFSQCSTVPTLGARRRLRRGRGRRMKDAHWPSVQDPAMPLRLEPGARLVAATHNPGKARELAVLLEDRFD